MTEFWKFAAGLGFFLLGMMLLEEALARLAGSSFKRFLRDHTRNPIEAIFVGIVVTALLQSSSLVTLMLLALTGAGIMSLRNALGVVIGANLGTTFTGWIVTLLGFKLNFDSVALPMVAIGCLGIVFLDPSKRSHYALRCIAGFGFLFMGLGHMKESAEGLATVVDIATLADYGLFVFLLFGLILTSVIQSSSASMLITLAAVNAEIIGLPQAAAIVIGSNLGTTITTILGALKGSAPKRQVALAHFLFNLVTDLVAFALLHPMLYLVVDVLKVEDPLYGVVAFHSIFNVIGILIFLPILGPFAKFLEKRFLSNEEHAAVFLHRVPVEDQELFMQALRKDLHMLTLYIVEYNLHVTGLDRNLHIPRPEELQENLRPWVDSPTRYSRIKDLQGEILAGCISLQEQKLSEQTSEEVVRVINAARDAVHSAKSVKDIEHNLRDCQDSANDILIQFVDSAREEVAAYYADVLDTIEIENPDVLFENIARLRGKTEASYDQIWNKIRELLRTRRLSDTEISTLNSINRELYSSAKSLASALGSWRLSEAHSRDLENLPGRS